MKFTINKGVLEKAVPAAGETTAVIPDNVRSIGYAAFSGCSGLTQVTIPGSVTSIGNRVFCDCSSLTQVTIPDNVRSIGESAFYGCSSLTQVTIPDGVTSIGESAFYGCSRLTQITIPDNSTQQYLPNYGRRMRITSRVAAAYFVSTTPNINDVKFHDKDYFYPIFSEMLVILGEVDSYKYIHIDGSCRCVYNYAMEYLSPDEQELWEKVYTVFYYLQPNCLSSFLSLKKIQLVLLGNELMECNEISLFATKYLPNCNSVALIKGALTGAKVHYKDSKDLCTIEDLAFILYSYCDNYNSSLCKSPHSEHIGIKPDADYVASQLNYGELMSLLKKKYSHKRKTLFGMA